MSSKGVHVKQIKHRYSDMPMARALGLIGNKETNLPRCNKDCRHCHACIEVDYEGNKTHVSLAKGSYKKRN